MRNAFRIFRRDMKRLLRSPAAVLVMIGVCIIPSLYAWFNIAANIDPYSNTSGIKVAVANNDKDATSNDLTINAGNEIIKNLKENDQLGWTFTDEENAVEGVKSGKYYAAIVIPEDFSSSLLSILSGKMETPKRIIILMKNQCNCTKNHRQWCQHNPASNQQYLFIHCI